MHWKQITSINSAGLWPFVSEGNRNGKITYASSPKSADFKTLGLDDSVTQESTWAGRNYEDVRAFSALATLQALKVMEEYAVLGGNSTAFGTAMTGVTPTYSTTQLATGKGSLTAGTPYSVKVSALTLQGVLQLAKGVPVATGIDSPGESMPSVVLTHSTAAGGQAGDTSISFDWVDVPGHAAYNVYAYTTTSVKFIATVYSNHYDLKALGTSTNTPNAADQTAGTNDFDGLLPQIAAGGYYLSLDGAAFTSDGAGGIAELENALQYQWDVNRCGCDEIWVNSQESRSIKTLHLNAGADSLVRVVVPAGDAQADMDAGAGVRRYYNNYTGQWIPIKAHPYLPKGTVIGLTHKLPEWFPNNEIPDAIIMAILEEYSDYQFAFLTRAYEHGVYMAEVPVMYAPGFSFMLTNIAKS